VFLRFICPALVVADSIVDLTGYDIPKMRRGLILCSKVIQNMANKVDTGSKEEYMAVLNEFVATQTPKIDRILQDLLNLEAMDEAPIGSGIVEGSVLKQLHRLLAVHNDAICKEISSLRHFSHAAGNDVLENRSLLMTRSATGSNSSRTTIETLNSLLLQLGTPEEVTPDRRQEEVSVFGGGSNPFHDEFMTQNEGRDISSMKSLNVFYEGGSSKV
jgi:neurofibromin 1